MSCGSPKKIHEADKEKYYQNILFIGIDDLYNCCDYMNCQPMRQCKNSQFYELIFKDVLSLYSHLQVFLYGPLRALLRLTQL